MTEEQKPPYKPEAPRFSAWIKPFFFIMGIVVFVVIYANVKDYFSYKVATIDLHSSHTGIEGCEGCHYPNRELHPQTCTVSKCHTAASFRAGKSETRSFLFQHIMHRDCMNCHTEHKGREGNLTKPFDHKNYTAQKCAECHMLPDSHIADTAEKDCGGCHALDSFKPGNAR